VFKPHPSVYQLAVAGSARREPHRFRPSNFWDVRATSFGFRTFWINRAGVQQDELGFPGGGAEPAGRVPGALQKSEIR
jgi:2-haloacid dehalogenase